MRKNGTEGKIEEGDGRITTILGLCGDIKESDKIVKCTKKFLVQCWKKKKRRLSAEN